MENLLESKTEVRKRVGLFIKKRRKALNLSQRDLKLLVGYAPNSIFLSKIERGECSLPVEKISIFAARLKCNANEFFDLLKPKTLFKVCQSCGCFYHPRYIKNSKCPACGEGVS